MNKILELQEELANIIIEYDKKIKRNLALEAKYNLEIPNEISEVTFLDNQIAICSIALKLASEGKTLEETQKVVSDLKLKATNFIITHNRKMNDFKILKNSNEKFTLEEIEDLNKKYESLVRKHHPAIAIKIPQTYDMQFKMLRNFYLLDNVSGFDGLLKENPTDSIVLPTEEEYIPRYEEYIAAYKKEMERVSKFDEKFAKLEEMLADDILLGRNQMVLRERAYKAKKSLGELFAKCDGLYEGKLSYKIK